MRIDSKLRYGVPVLSVLAALLFSALPGLLDAQTGITTLLVGLGALVVPLAGFRYAWQARARTGRLLRNFLSGFEEVPIPVLVVDGRRQVIAANRAFRELLGVSPEALTGGRVAEVLQGEWAQRFDIQHEALLVGRDPAPDQGWLPRAGRDPLYLRIRSMLLGDRHGDMRIVSFCEDLSESQRRAEEQAQLHERTQAFVQRLIDVIPQPVYLKDAQCRLVMVNTAYASARGMSREELLGRSPQELAREPEHGLVSYEEDLRVLAGGSVVKEERILDAEGKAMFRLITKGSCLNALGDPVIVGANFDVTHWRTVEQQLTVALQRETDRRRRTQKFVQRLIDVIPQPVYVKDAESRLVMVNEAYAAEWDLPRDKLIGKTVLELAPNNPRAAMATAQDREVLAGAVIHKEICAPDWANRKEHFWIVTKGACTDDEGHRVIVGAHFDITDLRMAERSLQRSLELQSRTRAFLQAMFDALPNPVSVKDSDLCYIMTNRAWELAFGLPADAGLGKHLVDYLPGGVNGDRMEETLHQLIGEPDGTVREGELAVAGGDGAVRHYMLRHTVTTDPEGKRVVLGVFADVSSVKAAEEQAMRALEEAERANEAKSLFLTNMSHELRTPMHAVLSFARLGQEKSRGAPELQRFNGYFERIVLSGERLMALLDDLLDLSKLESGHVAVQRVAVDLCAVAEEVVTEFGALLAGHRQSAHLAPHCRGMVVGDAMLLGQVVRNLLSNAMKFSPDGAAIDIDIRALPEGDGGWVELAVADRGVGIPEAELESVFDKFVQSSATRTGAGGTGLGLAICREIVFLHGGEIFARNREGGGARLVMRLPAQTKASHDPSGSGMQ